MTRREDGKELLALWQQAIQEGRDCIGRLAFAVGGLSARDESVTYRLVLGSMFRFSRVLVQRDGKVR